MNTNEAALRKVLEALPINSLVVIAAELERNQGRHAGDLPQDAQDAIADLETDIISIACQRLDSDDLVFLQYVSWWYKSHDSREWYQRIISHEVSGL